MDNKHKINYRLLAVSLFALIIIMTVMIAYTRQQNILTMDQIQETICQNTKEVANIIDSSVGYALNSIQVTSTAVSNTMTSEELENSAVVLNELRGNTPFSNIEYIRADGMNFTDAGKPFDASQREYYIQGISGNTGIWVNYTPKYSDEALLNFYTPLYFEGKIVGVLTGTIGGTTDILPMLRTEFYGAQFSGMLVDEENNIISSTVAFEKGTELTRDNAQIDESDKDLFFDAIKKADGSAFSLKGKKGYSIGSVSKIGKTGWRVIQIVPSVKLSQILKASNDAAYLSIGIVLFVSVCLFVLVLNENKKIAKQSIVKANNERDEQLAILKSMSDVYYSMHLLNLSENSVMEYSAHNDVKRIVDHSEEASEMMKEVIKTTIVDRDLGRALEFTDLTTLAGRMYNKKFVYNDFLGKHVGWIRLSFVVIEADGAGLPTKVVVTTQIIDEEKKREEKLLLESNTDELTQFYNRRAYEDDLAQYPSCPPEPDFVYVSMDINGLKNVNDNLGHAAGDELIIGATKCMRQCFGNYGRIYRTGGDEFVALIFASSERVEAIKEDFQETLDAWTGEYVDSVSVSCGFVSKTEFPDMTVVEMAKIADKRMYEAKALYYQNIGIDRRGQASAHKALCALYTKILRVNLSDDTYQIINMDVSEQNTDMGFSDKISTWLTNFAKSGQVHPENVDEYLRKTDIDYLRDYFKTGKQSLSVMYRRRIENEYKSVVMELIPADNYSNENQNVFLYVKTIDV